MNEIPKTLSFEEAVAELERIVRALESGQQKLDEAIAAYERGNALRRHCESLLADAESRVAAIVAGENGEPALKPIDPATI